jgi:hypothetical protein
MTDQEKLDFINEKRDDYRNAWVEYPPKKAELLKKAILEELKENGITPESLEVCDFVLATLIQKGYLKI